MVADRMADFSPKYFSFPLGRVGLRPLEAGDRQAFLVATQESVTLHGKWIQPPRDEASFEALLEKYSQPNSIAWVVTEIQTFEMVGLVHLSQLIFGPFQNAFLSYWVSQKFAGRGYMQEALLLAIHLSFGELGLHRLEANIQPENTASIRLVKRSGFVKEGFSEKYLQILGEWRDHERWAIHAEIWPERTLEENRFPRWS
jgi:ribosomal-protein-alanine N-acetyltransferase